MIRSDTQIRTRVRAGLAFLRAKVSQDCHETIRLDTLDISSDERCAAAQLFYGNFELAMDMLKLTGDADRQIQYGFLAQSRLSGGNPDKEYDLLTEAWRQEIAGLLAKSVEESVAA